MLSQNKHSQGGFTLVELMVVVAIIGILSSVAIPSFKKYQAKAKTSEAKLHLASIYSAEVSYFSDSDSYATCLNSMGYNPQGSKMQRYYTTGFTAHETAMIVNGSINGVQCNTDDDTDSLDNPASNPPHFLAGKKVAGVSADVVMIDGSGVDPDGGWFVAAAGGRISADGGTKTETASYFQKSIGAYAAEEEEGTGDTSDVKVGDGSYSVWAVNERKEIVQIAPGY